MPLFGWKLPSASSKDKKKCFSSEKKARAALNKGKSDVVFFPDSTGANQFCALVKIGNKEKKYNLRDSQVENSMSWDIDTAVSIELPVERKDGTTVLQNKTLEPKETENLSGYLCEKTHEALFKQHYPYPDGEILSAKLNAAVLASVDYTRGDYFFRHSASDPGAIVLCYKDKDNKPRQTQFKWGSGDGQDSNKLYATTKDGAHVELDSELERIKSMKSEKVAETTATQEMQAPRASSAAAGAAKPADTTKLYAPTKDPQQPAPGPTAGAAAPNVAPQSTPGAPAQGTKVELAPSQKAEKMWQEAQGARFKQHYPSEGNVTAMGNTLLKSPDYNPGDYFIRHDPSYPNAIVISYKGKDNEPHDVPFKWGTGPGQDSNRLYTTHTRGGDPLELSAALKTIKSLNPENAAGAPPTPRAAGQRPSPGKDSSSGQANTYDSISSPLKK